MCVCIIKAQNHEANEKVSELEQRPLRRETKIWLPGERPWNPEAAERGQRAATPGDRLGRSAWPCATPTGAGAQRGRGAAPHRRGLGGKTGWQWGEQVGGTATPSVAAVARARLAPSAQEAPPTRPALTSRRRSGDRPPGPACPPARPIETQPEVTQATPPRVQATTHGWAGAPRREP